MKSRRCKKSRVTNVVELRYISNVESFGNAALCTHGFYGIFTRPDKGITTSLENVQHVMHVTGSERAISREKVDKKRGEINGE